MTTIGPGTPVIFVGPDDNPPDSWFGRSGLTIGALYFVSGFVRCSFLECGCTRSISLRGSPGRWRFYDPCAFKPLNDGESTALEVEVPWRESEPA